MARKDTFAKNNRSKSDKKKKDEGFGFLRDKMDFDIVSEPLANISGSDKEDTKDVSVELEESSSEVTKGKNDKSEEILSSSTENTINKDKEIDYSTLSDEELLSMLENRKVRKTPNKNYGTIPNADGTIPNDSEQSKTYDMKKAIADKSSKKDGLHIAKFARSKKVAKTFKLPSNLVDDIDDIFRDENGNRIAGTKGMMSVLVSNAIVEYMVSQGFKDKEYLSNLEEFKN